MLKTPTLFVIAGCNGAGKSSFSQAIIPTHLTSFDYDKHFLDIYNSLFDSELRDRMAHNMARNKLEKAIQKSIAKQNDFCYETNFNSTPLFWPNIFKSANFNIELIYFCLNSIEEAKRRVQIRVENGGHYVPEKEIENRFIQGYHNLNKYFRNFDVVHLLDSSNYGEEPHHILSLYSGNLVVSKNLPNFLQLLLPEIKKLAV